MSFQPHREAIPDQTLAALETLIPLPDLEEFYLAGGTAMALQIGHRVSYDLDFFSFTNKLKAPERERLASKLIELPSTIIRSESDTMLYATVMDVEASFIYQHHPLLRPPEKLETLSIATLVDIGLMKLAAIKDRGRRRDFVDLYCLRHVAPLETLFDLLPEKYYDRPDFALHLAYGLRYFVDAEDDPRELVMLQTVRWADVKKYCEAGARLLTRRLTDLDPRGL